MHGPIYPLTLRFAPMTIQDIRQARRSASDSSHLNNWRKGGGEEGDEKRGEEASIKNALSELTLIKKKNTAGTLHFLCSGRNINVLRVLRPR